jgi:hypothetical protein
MISFTFLSFYPGKNIRCPLDRRLSGSDLDRWRMEELLSLLAIDPSSFTTKLIHYID